METSYNPDVMMGNITLMANIIRWHAARPFENPAMPTRAWHYREQRSYPLHTAVVKAIKLARPNDWHRLLLEWPHIPKDGSKGRVAYTQNEMKGERDLQTVTSLGKYLHSHFATLPDHAIRDIVAGATASGMKFVHTIAEMLFHLHRGPGSCMVWGGRDPDNHPYRTYDPKFGWHMCVHTEDDDTIGRALCYQSGDEKFYVRTYRKTSGQSSNDEEMEQWLQDQGYKRRDGWDGCFLARLPGIHGCDFLAPYLDGDAQRVDTDRLNGERVLVISESGEYECCNTDGTYDAGDREECEECGEVRPSDDMYWVGRNDDTSVCEYCRDEYYRYAYGRGRDQYYVHQDDVVYVESQDDYYHDSYLSDNDIIQLENGEYEHEDNAVEIDGDWYHVDDDDIVCLENGDYALRDNAYECAGDGKWYSRDDEPPVEVDGEMYHPDNAPEQEETT